MNFASLRPGRKIVFAAIATGGLLTVLVGGIKLSFVMTRYRGESLLAEVKMLKLGKSTNLDARKLVFRYGGSQLPEDNSICIGNDCLFFEIPVTNRITESLLRIGWFIGRMTGVWHNLCDDLLPWRAMYVGIHSKAGRITRIDISLHARRRDGFSLQGRTEQVPFLPEVFEPLRPGYRPGVFHMTTPGGGAGVIARITPQAISEDRQRAFDLNLSCLSSIRGCKERRELMPSVWEDHQAFLRMHTVEAAP